MADLETRLADTIRYFQPLGHLDGCSADDRAAVDGLIEAITSHWGFDRDDLAEQSDAALDQFVLGTDHDRAVELANEGYRPDEDAYLAVLAGCVRLAAGDLVVDAEAEDWTDHDTVQVRWQVGEVEHRAEPGAKYFDQGFLTDVSRSLATPGRHFVAVDDAGWPLLLLLDDETIERLRAERGWSMWPLPEQLRTAPARGDGPVPDLAAKPPPAWRRVAGRLFPPSRGGR